MKAIPNQPVSFSENPTYYLGTSECDTDEVVYNQLVDNTDTTQFQLNIDPCEDAEQVIANPNFVDVGDDWQLGDNWSWGVDKVCCTDAENGDILECSTALPTGYYKFTIIVDSLSGGRLNITNNSVFLINIYESGTYTFYGYGYGTGWIDIDVVGTVDCCISEFTAYFIDTDFEVKVFDSTETEVESIDIATNPEYFFISENTLTVDIAWASIGVIDGCYFLMAINPCTGGQLISNMFNVGDFTSKCTLLINACNNNNLLGFAFLNTGFSPRIRLEAKLKNSQYLQEASIFENSAGTKGAYYFSRRKTKVLAIDLQPEYVHDFLSTLRGYDNFFIDNVAYFVEDSEYSVIYINEMDSFGSVVINVSEKTQNVKNILCTDDENSCNLAV